MTDRPTHGGRRAGAGRKPLYGEPTRTVRVPASLTADVRRFLEARRWFETGDGPGAELVSAAAERPLPLPLYVDRIAAGFPAPADDAIDERLDLNDHLIRHPGDTFYVRARGASMTGAGIGCGDLLVVDRRLEPADGKIVVAALGAELTVKRLRRAGNRLYLLPDNPDFPPLEVTAETGLVIWGVVTAVVRRL